MSSAVHVGKRRHCSEECEGAIYFKVEGLLSGAQKHKFFTCEK